MKEYILFGASVAGLGAVSFLIWYSKASSKSKYRMEIPIPNSAVGFVIGRNGSTLKNIQIQSKVKIKFIAPDMDSNYSTCVIKGDKSRVQIAASIIKYTVQSFTDRDAESEISDEFDLEMSDDGLFKTISNAVNDVLSSRANNSVNHTIDLPSAIQTENVYDFIAHHTQKLCSPGGDGLIPVYVSASVDPSKFWVQTIKTREHAELDRLTLEMSEYFDSHPELNVPAPFSDIKLGYLCVVYHEDDKRWYRAEVREVFMNEKPANNNLLDTVVDLYFLDFGESVYAKVTNLRPIPPKFLGLHFQAIECGLSNVKPNGDSWSEEAIQFFEDLVHVSQWYPLMARIDFHEEGYLPYVALIDTNGETSFNVAERLVLNAFAVALD